MFLVVFLVVFLTQNGWHARAQCSFKESAWKIIAASIFLVLCFFGVLKLLANLSLCNLITLVIRIHIKLQRLYEKIVWMHLSPFHDKRTLYLTIHLWMFRNCLILSYSTQTFYYANFCWRQHGIFYPFFEADRRLDCSIMHTSKKLKFLALCIWSTHLLEQNLREQQSIKATKRFIGDTVS